MNIETTRTIDELGRIVLPTNFRKQLNWGTGDKIALSCENGKIVLSLSKGRDDSACVPCGKHEGRLSILFDNQK